MIVPARYRREAEPAPDEAAAPLDGASSEAPQGTQRGGEPAEAGARSDRDDGADPKRRASRAAARRRAS